MKAVVNDRKLKKLVKIYGMKIQVVQNNDTGRRTTERSLLGREARHWKRRHCNGNLHRKWDHARSLRRGESARGDIISPFGMFILIAYLFIYFDFDNYWIVLTTVLEQKQTCSGPPRWFLICSSLWNISSQCQDSYLFCPDCLFRMQWQHLVYAKLNWLKVFFFRHPEWIISFHFFIYWAFFSTQWYVTIIPPLNFVITKLACCQTMSAFKLRLDYSCWRHLLVVKKYLTCFFFSFYHIA